MQWSPLEFSLGIWVCFEFEQKLGNIDEIVVASSEMRKNEIIMVSTATKHIYMSRKNKEEPKCSINNGKINPSLKSKVKFKSFLESIASHVYANKLLRIK